MSLRGKQPLLRRAYNYAIPLACAFSLLALQPVFAQTSSNLEFASSTQGLTADLEPAGSSSAPAAGAAGQSGGTYGYHDKSLTSHLTFEGGGGFNAPIGNDLPFITWGGNFTGGVGYRFDKRFSVLAEYQFMDDKLPGGFIELATGSTGNGGNAHIWSFTLDPVIDLFPKAKNSVYVTGGGGFYRKLTSFTEPVTEDCFGGFYTYPCTENLLLGHFSSNQGGVNVGVGITHTLGSPDMGSSGKLKAYAEARYVWLDTPGVTSPNGTGSTELIPVTLGLRW